MTIPRVLYVAYLTFVVMACVIASGIAETSRLQVMDATSVEATMAQMGVTQ